MKSLLTACIVCLVCLSSFVVPATADGGVGVDPATITGSLKPGETQNAQINVMLPESVPRGDVVFAFDTTGSMYFVVGAMKSQGIQVMNAIRVEINDTRFGAASFMDYPKNYSDYYGYTCKKDGNVVPCVYGNPEAGDYDFRMDQDLTTDIDTASAAIKNIPKGKGGDNPQDYTRVIYESQFFNWRPDAKKIFVIFGDAPPHAAPNGTTLDKPWEPGKLFTHLEYGAPYGGDPGRDQIPYTDDDLDYDLVIHDIAGKYITIVGVYCPFSGQLDPDHTDAENNFRYMAYMTNGIFVLSDPNSEAPVIAAQIVSKIREMAKQNIRELGLQVEESKYSGWVTSPDVYNDVPWPSTNLFNVAITPPAGTSDGDYTFPVDVVGDGVVLGYVTVTVHVVSGQVVTPPTNVSIDIKPGSCPNSFNIKEKGVLPVAILGDKDLKVSTIDPESINLTRDGGTEGVKPIRSSIEDVASPSTKNCSCGYKTGKPDRKPDLTLKFDSQDVVKKLGIKKGEGCIKVTITGLLRSSDPNVPGKVITGSDYLRVLDTGSGNCGGDDSKDEKGSRDDKGSGDNKGSCGDKGSSDDNGHKGEENHGDH